MPGPDLPEDPRDQTVDLPRIEPRTENGSAGHGSSHSGTHNGHSPPLFADLRGRDGPPYGSYGWVPDRGSDPYAVPTETTKAGPPAALAPSAPGDAQPPRSEDQGRDGSLSEPAPPSPAAAAEPAPPPAAAAEPAPPPAAAAEPAPPPAAAAQPAPPPSPRRRPAGERARPAAGALAALRERLDRLPDGHPSSPYDDDGIAKAPPLRLREVELGIPAPDRPQPAIPRPRSAAWLPADIGPDHVTERAPDGSQASLRPLAASAGEQPVVTPLDPPPQPADAQPSGAQPADAQRASAERILAAARAAEGRNMFGSYGNSGLTPAVRRIAAQLRSGGLAPGSETETLKSAGRLAAKLARLVARHPDRPAGELAEGVCDVVRYAFAFEPADYAESTWLVHRKLKVQGFELMARRNQWDSQEYKGIWTCWRDPAHDLLFEVQFHTSGSWDVVRRTHPDYVAITDPATPPAERARLRTRQVAAAATVKPPPGCAEFDDVGWGAR